MVRVPKERAPTHPGEVLVEEFLTPLGLTQRQLADAILAPYQRVNEIVNGRRGVTPATALRLAKFFGTTPDLWLNLQMRWDLYQAQHEEQGELARVIPYRPATLASPAVQEPGPTWQTDAEPEEKV